MSKVLIDRELVNEIRKALQAPRFRSEYFRLSQAIEQAPPAVIAIEKAHDCATCPGWGYDAMEYRYCNCGHQKCIDHYYEQGGAPDDCPQICKE